MKAVSKCGLIVVFCIQAWMVQASDIGKLDQESASALFGPPHYSPYAGRNFPSQVFWGDTHLHTSLSMDAGAFGNRLGMDDAYRFSKGEEIIASSGQNARLGRPLDWVVIADHSDGMGLFTGLLEQDPQLMKYEDGRRWSGMIRDGRGGEAALELIGKFSQGALQWSSVFLRLQNGITTRASLPPLLVMNGPR